MYKKILLWILVLLCMGMIFCFSSQKATESDKTSLSFAGRIIQMLDMDDSLTPEEIEKTSEDINHVVRKGAHFSIYGLLGALILLLIIQYNVRLTRVLPYSTLISMLYACSDEYHQTFVPGRSGQLSDILLDTAGAFCGAVLVMFVVVLIKSRKHRERSVKFF